MSGGGFKLPLIPYVDGATYNGITVVAANNGYARYSNLSTAKSIWSDTTSAGDKGNALTPPPTAATFRVSTQNVRWRTTTNPTTSEGIRIEPGQPFSVDNSADLIRTLKFIEETATAELCIQYFYQY
jgi:hypothetical protein